MSLDRPSERPGQTTRTTAPASATDLRTTLPVGPAQAPPAGPADVPGFTVLRELGRGGMGVVYLARQHAPGRLVALKMVQAGAAAGPMLRERFRLEGEAIARLAHPGIVQVFACGEHNGVPYLVLEYVDGHGLDRVEIPLAPRAAAALLARVARAVGHAHERGIVHRDLKPANVLLTGDGEPKVTDFGLAKFDPALAPAPDDLHAGTRTGAILGSPRYMAPEQAAGRVGAVGPATDVHALGAVLYELLTGRPAFAGDTVLDTLERVRTADPVPVRALAPRVPRDLETVCLKCLQKDPNKRYASAGELADDLDRFLAGEPVRARRAPPWERAVKWARRYPEAALLRGTIALLLVPTVVGALRPAPVPGLFAFLNAVLAAALVLRISTWVRSLGLAGCALAVIAERRVLVGSAPFGEADWEVTGAVWLYFLLGVACGLTGRLAGRHWGRDPAGVTGVSLLCGGCGVILFAIPAMAVGWWSLLGVHLGAALGFLACGVLGGVVYARSGGRLAPDETPSRGHTSRSPN